MSVAQAYQVALCSYTRKGGFGGRTPNRTDWLLKATGFTHSYAGITSEKPCNPGNQVDHDEFLLWILVMRSCYVSVSTAFRLATLDTAYGGYLLSGSRSAGPSKRQVRLTSPCQADRVGFGEIMDRTAFQDHSTLVVVAHSRGG